MSFSRKKRRIEYFSMYNKLFHEIISMKKRKKTARAANTLINQKCINQFRGNDNDLPASQSTIIRKFITRN